MGGFVVKRKKTLVKGEEDWFECLVNDEHVFRVYERVVEFLRVHATNQGEFLAVGQLIVEWFRINDVFDELEIEKSRIHLVRLVRELERRGLV